jgi:hypothetical protein
VDRLVKSGLRAIAGDHRKHLFEAYWRIELLSVWESIVVCLHRGLLLFAEALPTPPSIDLYFPCHPQPLWRLPLPPPLGQHSQSTWTALNNPQLAPPPQRTHRNHHFRRKVHLSQYHRFRGAWKRTQRLKCAKLPRLEPLTTTKHFKVGNPSNLKDTSKSLEFNIYSPVQGSRSLTEILETDLRNQRILAGSTCNLLPPHRTLAWATPPRLQRLSTIHWEYLRGLE